MAPAIPSGFSTAVRISPTPLMSSSYSSEMPDPLGDAEAHATGTEDAGPYGAGHSADTSQIGDGQRRDRGNGNVGRRVDPLELVGAKNTGDASEKGSQREGE